MRSSSVKVVASVAAWVFGISTSILFISLWGRAVVVDTDELGQSLRPMSESTQVTGLFADWMTEELIEAGIPRTVAESATNDALVIPEVAGAMDRFVVELVDAAASPVNETGAVDVAEILSPTTPAVTRSLNASGVPATETQVEEVMARLDPLVVRQPGQEPLVGFESPLASRLGTAVVVASIALVAFGAIYTLAGEDRLRRIRTLLTRVGLTGLSFSVMLKLGAWILDPNGGRAPISESLSQLADAKWGVPAAFGGVAAFAALSVWLVRSSVRPVEESRQVPVAPIRQAGSLRSQQGSH